MSYDTGLFLVVEGKVADPYFADVLCSSSPVISGAGYEVLLIAQIEAPSGANTGGKQAVEDLFNYCKRAGKLVQVNSAGPRSIAFLLDRDSCDVTGGIKRSPHIVYTVYADTEAHLFIETDQVAMLGVAASLDRASAMSVVATIGDWRKDLANSWRPWIELCYLNEATCAGAWPSLGHSRSLVHKGKAMRTLDSVTYSAALTAIETASPLLPAAFATRKRVVLARIDARYRAGRQVEFLKGKWLPSRLAHAVEGYFHGVAWNPNPWHRSGFEDAVTRCCASHLVTNAPGLSRMRAKLELLV